ncbi:hypothetical protein [Deinococcus yavapaiensis]|nr:hypothetical protein [Deinococcus yavapaiensis]
MNGIWRLTKMTSVGTAPVLSPLPTTDLFIVGNSIRGRLGCGTYEGTIAAANNAMQMKVAPLPPKPSERCLYAVPGVFHQAMNTSWGYIISGDTQRLVVFSETAWLSFERIGYVTPTQK